MAQTEKEAEYQVLLQASAASSEQVRLLERVLLRLTPQSLSSFIIYAELKAAQAREKELRAFVRNHPNHSYEGL